MRKVIVWITISAILSIAFFFENSISPDKFSISYIQRTGAYPFIVLTFCLIMLYIKRKKVMERMQDNTGLPCTLTGISLAGLSFFIPGHEPPFQILAVLFIITGLFMAVFGKAVLIPLALLGIYCFALLFPPFILWTGDSFPLATTNVLVNLLSPFLEIENKGQTIRFFDSGGNGQTYLIDAACSGSVSLALFFSLFFLMMIDTPLSGKKALYLLVFGLVGTSLQNILRLVLLVVIGYLFGSQWLWTSHIYGGYFLFFAWYAVFAYIYMRHSGSINK